MILFLLILTITIFMIKNIYQLHDFNSESEIIQLQNANSVIIQEKYKELSPLIVHNSKSSDIQLETIVNENPGYIINDNGRNIILQTFLDTGCDTMSIYKNEKLCKDLNIHHELKECSQNFFNEYNCNINYALSMFKGNNAIELTKNKRNILLLRSLQHPIVIYLFNPKHKEDILTKENHEIKKWAYKINLEPNLILYIPPEWYYFYETTKPTVIGSIESDTYFTYFYNLLR